jgi:threonine/homoserine/homoserine lactone efflux protein
VLAASETAYDTLRLVGAAYLVWLLGVQSLLAARRGYHGGETVQGAAHRGPSPFRQAGVHILLGLVWLSTYAWLLDRALEAFRGSRVRRVLDALTGAVLVGLGVRVAAD